MPPTKSRTTVDAIVVICQYKQSNNYYNDQRDKLKDILEDIEDEDTPREVARAIGGAIGLHIKTRKY